MACQMAKSRSTLARCSQKMGSKPACSVGDVAHVAAAADQAVDGVVHVLEGGVGSAAAVGGSGVRERGVVGLFGHQLIRRVVNGLSIGLESQVG